MVTFFTRAPGSICHHLQRLHKPHGERFMAISPFDPHLLRAIPAATGFDRTGVLNCPPVHPPGTFSPGFSHRRRVFNHRIDFRSHEEGKT